jgi:hypothetical protein
MGFYGLAEQQRVDRLLEERGKSCKGGKLRQTNTCQEYYSLSLVLFLRTIDGGPSQLCFRNGVNVCDRLHDHDLELNLRGLRLFLEFQGYLKPHNEHILFACIAQYFQRSVRRIMCGWSIVWTANIRRVSIHMRSE